MRRKLGINLLMQGLLGASDTRQDQRGHQRAWKESRSQHGAGSP
jgi:hypothetical protein